MHRETHQRSDILYAVGHQNVVFVEAMVPRRLRHLEIRHDFLSQINYKFLKKMESVSCFPVRLRAEEKGHRRCGIFVATGFSTCGYKKK